MSFDFDLLSELDIIFLLWRVMTRDLLMIYSLRPLATADTKSQSFNGQFICEFF